jgi:hypothetical protein
MSKKVGNALLVPDENLPNQCLLKEAGSFVRLHVLDVNYVDICKVYSDLSRSRRQ